MGSSQGAGGGVASGAMGRRSRAGDEGAGILVLVVGAFSLPVVLGYYWPVAGIVFVMAISLLAVALFRPGAAPGDGLAGRRVLVVGGWFLLSLLVLAGVVSGDDARRAERAETATRARSEAEAARVSAERERVEREARARAEATERQRIAAERAFEASQTPHDRASIALSILSGQVENRVARVCRARHVLSPLGREHRTMPEVRAAQHLLRSEERQALREVREDARGGRMILCCDGMTSPSCGCGRSNRRGCCSWHGGICGCEPLPSEITCPSSP